jgi:hypothetical protein
MEVSDKAAGMATVHPPDFIGNGNRRTEDRLMSGTGWGITAGIIYLVLIFTIAVLSFRKGHWVLGLLGFVFPVLWLIGAIMPARRAYR